MDAEKGRFVVFVYDAYEPNGGWNDVLREGNYNEGEVMRFRTQSDAFSTGHGLASEHGGEYVVQVLDLLTGTLIAQDVVITEIKIDINKGPRTPLLP